MMDEKQKMVETRNLGDACKAFMEQDVGRYLLAKADEHKRATAQKLAQVNAAETEAIRDLQAEWKVPELFMSWLDQAIQSGEVARYQIAQLNEEDY